MKKIILLFLLLNCLNLSAQNPINQIIGQVTQSGSLSNEDIIKGLKEALSVGSNNATASAAKLDGFYKNNLIKIPFPTEARDMKNTLLSLGMKKQVDAFEKQLNRAAEDAAKKAAPVFLDAISKITINDGLNILQGNKDAATQFLKSKTTDALIKEFKPVVQNSLSKVQITKYWSPLANAYDKIPFVNKVNPDLEQYVSERAIDGLFKLIAVEEGKIRDNPSARISDILKKVFGK